MSAIGTILRELVALFVDDGSLAVLSLLWLAVCGFALPLLGVADDWRAAVLFIGLAAILAENALRAARGRP
jgi:hypothetical protein